MLNRLLQSKEERAITYQSLFLTDQMFTGATRSGVAMNSHEAMKVGVVYAAVRLIADSIATLPVGTFERRDDQRFPSRRPDWLDYPEPDRAVGRIDHFQMVLMSLLIDGNAYVRKLYNDSGDLIALKVLDPTRIEPRVSNEGMIEFIWNSTRILSHDEILWIPDILRPGAVKGLSRVSELKEVLGISRALDDFSARFFGSGTLSSGIIEVPGDMTEEQAVRLKDQFEKGSKGLRNAHRPAVLTAGAKFQKIASDPQESQLVQSREFAVVEVARIFKIQPALLGVMQPGAMSYASVEQQHIQFVTLTLRPYISKIEEQYSRLLPGEAFLRFNMEGLLRGDLASRFNAYSQGIQAGFLSINDIRTLEDLTPIDSESAMVPRVPLANVDLAAANIVETEKRIGMAVRLIQVGFDPAEVLQSLNLPDVAHTGLPSVQLQNAGQETEVDISEVYLGNRATDVAQEERDVAEELM
jgi:HK97 family phage portal protein